MPTLKKFATASRSGLRTIVLTKQTVAANGDVTDSGSTEGTNVFTLTGRIRSLNFQDSMATENVSAITSANANHVGIERDQAIQISIFKVDDGTNPDPLLSDLKTGDVWKIEWTEGSVASTTKAKRTRYMTPTQFGATEATGKGAIIGSVSFAQVDVGSFTEEGNSA